MPYTVNFFLSQVSLGLFNGCSFHRNAHHVVQGGPVANHLSHGTNLYKGFKSAGLESVSFQEYSPDFPHVKYTLGYAGRPGGPDFYVSTLGKVMMVIATESIFQFLCTFFNTFLNCHLK